MAKKDVNQRITQSISPYKETRAWKKYLPALLAFFFFFVIGSSLLWMLKDELPFMQGSLISNKEQLLEQLTRINEKDNNFNVIMSSQWTFRDGTSPSKNAYVENSIDNINAFYFTVTRDSNEEILYLSPTLKVGDKLTDIQLSVPLPKGEYSALLTYYLLDENGISISTVPMKIQIIIKN